MALPVPSDRHRRLHSGQVMSDPEVHRGPLRPGVRPHCGRGLLLSPGGDRAGKKDQTSDLGHCRTREVQVQTILYSLLQVSLFVSLMMYKQDCTNFTPCSFFPIHPICYFMFLLFLAGPVFSSCLVCHIRFALVKLLYYIPLIPKFIFYIH